MKQWSILSWAIFSSTHILKDIFGGPRFQLPSTYMEYLSQVVKVSFL